MVGTIYNYDSLKIYILSGEPVIFNNETDKIEKFF